jgi:hypothetical protein
MKWLARFSEAERGTFAGPVRSGAVGGRAAGWARGRKLQLSEIFVL